MTFNQASPFFAAVHAHDIWHAPSIQDIVIDESVRFESFETWRLAAPNRPLLFAVSMIQ
jgi:hypothetical protein